MSTLDGREEMSQEEIMQFGFLRGLHGQLEKTVGEISLPDGPWDGDLSDMELYGFLLADIAVSLRKLSGRPLEENPYNQEWKLVEGENEDDEKR